MNLTQEQVTALNATGRYKVLTKFESAVLKAPASLPSGTAYGVVIDTETTGVDILTAKIIEVGLVRFAFNPVTAEIYGIVDTYSALEDPGQPIPPEATQVNGITDLMVKGKTIDDEAVARICDEASFLIAHNASYDRPLVDLRFPFLKGLKWGCSLREVDWAGAGITSAKLDYIAYKLGFFFEAHRAQDDCEALLYALSQPIEVWNGDTPFKELLKNVDATTYQVWALNAPFEVKELLKGQGYRWSDGSKPGTQKSWYRDVPESALDSELAWVKANVFKGRDCSVGIATYSAKTRHQGHPAEIVRRYL